MAMIEFLILLNEMTVFGGKYTRFANTYTDKN